MPILAILLVVGALTFVALVAYVQHVREKQRAQKLAELATSLGLDFSPAPNRTLSTTLEPIGLFTQGRGRTAWNVMSGGTDDERLTLFDYRYTVGSGKQQQTPKRTVVAFESRLLNLPQFELRPETLFDRVSGFFGSKEIDFQQYPEFSKRYHLTGQNAERVRELFSEQLVRKFESLRDVCAAGTGPRLVFYRASSRASIESFRSLMEDAYAIYSLLKAPPTDPSNPHQVPDPS